MIFNYTTKWKWEIFPQSTKPQNGAPEKMWVRYEFLEGRWFNPVEVYYSKYET